MMTMMKKKLYKMMMASKVCLVSFEHKRRLRWKTFGNACRKNGNGTPGHMEILTLEMHGSKFLRKLAVSKGFGREVLVWFGEDGWKCQKKWLSEAVALSQLVDSLWDSDPLMLGFSLKNGCDLQNLVCRFVGRAWKGFTSKQSKIFMSIFWHVYIICCDPLFFTHTILFGR